MFTTMQLRKKVVKYCNTQKRKLENKLSGYMLDCALLTKRVVYAIVSLLKIGVVTIKRRF